MNSGKEFSSLDDKACSYQCPDKFQLLPGQWQAKSYWISWDHQWPNFLENNPNNTKNNMKSQIWNKRTKEVSVCERNYYTSILTYFLRIMNNRHRIISVHGAPL